MQGDVRVEFSTGFMLNLTKYEQTEVFPPYFSEIPTALPTKPKNRTNLHSTVLSRSKHVYQYEFMRIYVFINFNKFLITKNRVLRKKNLR